MHFHPKNRYICGVPGGISCQIWWTINPQQSETRLSRLSLLHLTISRLLLLIISLIFSIASTGSIKWSKTKSVWLYQLRYVDNDLLLQLYVNSCPQLTYKPVHEGMDALVLWSFAGHVLQKPFQGINNQRWQFTLNTQCEDGIIMLHDCGGLWLKTPVRWRTHHLLGRHDGADEDTKWN